MTVRSPAVSGVPQSVDTRSTYILLAFASVLLASGIIGSKVASTGFPAITAATLRIMVVAIITGPIVLGRNRPTVRWVDVLTFLALGGVGFLAVNVIYFSALKQTTASHASLMLGVAPIITGILSAIIIRERLRSSQHVGIVITTLGVAVIVVSGAAGLSGDSTLTGDALVLASQICGCIYSIYAWKVMRRFTPIQLTAFTSFGALVFLVPLSLLTDLNVATLQGAPRDAWLGLLYSSTVSMLFGSIILTTAIKRIGATRVSVFNNLMPIWGLVLSALLVGEVITLYHLFAAVLVIGGVFLANKR